MGTNRIWIVRAGKGAAFADEFAEQGLVAIGWREVGPVTDGVNDSELERQFKEAYPEWRRRKQQVALAQVRRFVRGIQVGDPVATYNPEQRLYFIGTVDSDAQWREHELPRYRRVKWVQKVARDQLTVRTRNGLGSIATLFRASPEASNELRAKAVSIDQTVPAPSLPGKARKGDGNSGAIVREEIVEKGEQFIEDRIAKLDWDELQELMAGILRAMGYLTRVAPAGPDRGVDIFASPDGLGLQEPRIFVEVKHRTGTPISAQEVRAFLGGRQQGDKCLYVSTGGFTKDAKYEAERSTVPITLLALPEIQKLLVSHYEGVDATVKALVPLQKLYWPAD